MTYHPMGMPPVSGRGASNLDPAEHRPRADIEVPPGCLAVQIMNAHATSAAPDGHQPGDIAVLPHDEARSLLRQGLAREVIADG
jgi:hypothetical protein